MRWEQSVRKELYSPTWGVQLWKDKNCKARCLQLSRAPCEPRGFSLFVAVIPIIRVPHAAKHTSCIKEANLTYIVSLISSDVFSTCTWVGHVAFQDNLDFRKEALGYVLLVLDSLFRPHLL